MGSVPFDWKILEDWVVCMNYPFVSLRDFVESELVKDLKTLFDVGVPTVFCAQADLAGPLGP